jgi:hypothetical protein
VSHNDSEVPLTRTEGSSGVFVGVGVDCAARRSSDSPDSPLWRHPACPAVPHRGVLAHFRVNMVWSRLGSNQRPSACEADALPLSHGTGAERANDVEH